jgi:hypothetical protein
LKKPKPTAQKFFGEKIRKTECRYLPMLGAKSTRVSLPDKGMGRAVTTFLALRRASTVRNMMSDAPACGS